MSLALSKKHPIGVSTTTQVLLRHTRFKNLSMAEKNVIRKAARYLRQTVKSKGLTKPPL